MKLHEIKGAEGARKDRRRVGRGHGSGRGKTSGRGTKGQLSRGDGFRVGFEGGQMPFAQRVPKLGGFKNPFRVEYALVNLSKLAVFKDGSKLDPEAFQNAGLAEPGRKIKVLGAGKLRRKLAVEAHAFSEAARAAIEARGGSVVVLEPKPKKERKKTKGPKVKPAAAEAEEAEAAEPAQKSEETEAKAPEQPDQEQSLKEGSPRNP